MGMKSALQATALGAFVWSLFGSNSQPQQQRRAVIIKSKARGADDLKSRIAGAFGDSVFDRVGGVPGQSKPAPAPAPANSPNAPMAGHGLGPLLDVIGRAEAPSYDTYWGGINLADQPPAKLTEMTIGEVLAWQDSIDHKYMSEAAGRYQIMEDTLRGLYRKAGLTKDDLFSPANQDRLAIVLMEGAGLKSYRAGRITPEKFGDKLARVWAGLPVHSPQKGRHIQLKRGQSYYAGDSLNRATVKSETVANAIRRI